MIIFNFSILKFHKYCFLLRQAKTQKKLYKNLTHQAKKRLIQSLDRPETLLTIETTAI